MNRLRRRLVVGAAALVMAAATSCASNAEASKTNANGDTTISVGVYPQSATMLVLSVAQAKGFFGESNLEVEEVASKNGQDLASALIGGSTAIAFGFPATFMPAMAQGQDFLVMGPYMNYDFAIVVPEDSPIQSISDLEGKNFGVPSRGSAVEDLVKLALTEGGMSPDAVNFIAVGGVSSQGPALSSGAIDVTIAAMSTLAVFESQGTPVRAIASAADGDLGEFGEVGLQGSWATTSAYATENPEVISGFCVAMDKAMKWMADPANTAEGNQILAELLGVDVQYVGDVWEVDKSVFDMQIDQARWDKNVQIALKGQGSLDYDKFVHSCESS